ncbi:MAG: hypothetical protein GZ087_09280 [Flavobacterium sp.]|nr:hypothetical protein [Flavobacterium sp.]
MNQIDLKNKKILYIGSKSFNYDQFLVEKLENFGANVVFFQIDITSIYFRTIKKFGLPGINSYKNNFYNNMLLGKNYDYVLVRYGHQLSEEFLGKLRSANPNAKFINFHWDSITALYNYLHIIPYFDKVFSFDVKDCQTYREINYLPLFYLDCYGEFRKNDTDKLTNIDLLFIGSWRNQERYHLIKLTEEFCRQQGLHFYFYLHFSLLAQLDSIRREVIIAKQARYKTLSEKEILNLFARSNTIIDFPSSYQSGLTIRTFEALGAGKKLITTNKNILKEPFYNPEHISLMDVNEFNLDVDFIRNKPVSSIEESIGNYSIGNYISKLFQ